MADLTKEMVNARREEIESGTFHPHIPGLDNLVFVKMTPKVKGISSRAYSKRLMELFAEGGYYSESLLPQILKKICAQHGIDVNVLKQSVSLQKKIYDNAPEDLIGPYDSLTDEEVAKLSPEDRAKRRKAIEDRGRRYVEFLSRLFTEEEKEMLEQIKQIEELQQKLKTNTAEHWARKYQMEVEIYHCTRCADDSDKHYFESPEAVTEIEDQKALILLYGKWRLFREGRDPDFFSL